MVKKGNSAHKAATCRFTARHPQSSRFSPLLFQVKHLHTFLHLLYLLKGDCRTFPGKHKSTTGLFGHGTVCADNYHSLTNQLLKASCPIASELEETLRLVCGRSYLLNMDSMADVFYIKLKLAVNFHIFLHSTF